MKTTGAILILSFACLNLLFLQSTVSGTNATEGVCFKNFKENFGCKRVIRGRAIRGKKITFDDCCSKYNGAGWATKRKDRRSCTSCPKWSEWSDYSPCPVTCGISNKVRTRICHGTQQKGGPYCKGDSKEYKKCIGSVPNCPIHGGWSNWTKWSACSKTCEEGLQTRARTCDNPVPKYGGNMCVGQNNDMRNCTERQKCPIDGGWGRWGPWSQCSRACGIGNKTRTRPCNNPKPQFGGKPCPKSQGIAIWLCRLSKCPPTAAPSNSGSGSGVLSESSGFVAASGSGSDSSSGESGGGSGDVWSSIRKKRAAGLSDDEDY